eukprot:TsM_000374600 transcript=TsM_000374600 gene=TsM_000374600
MSEVRRALAPLRNLVWGIAIFNFVVFLGFWWTLGRLTGVEDENGLATFDFDNLAAFVCGGHFYTEHKPHFKGGVYRYLDILIHRLLSRLSSGAAGLSSRSITETPPAQIPDADEALVFWPSPWKDASIVDVSTVVIIYLPPLPECQPQGEQLIKS